MITVTPYATGLLTFGIAIHLFCDWILQNDWMARNKVSPFHLAAWVHSGIHFIGLLFIFPPLIALAIAATHFWIDTRGPLQLWRKFFRQTTEGPVALHVALWGDQVAHVTILAIAALVIGGTHP